jgi:hypothetical protein
MSEWNQGLTLIQNVVLRFPPQYHISYKWGYLLSPITYKYLLKVLCPVRRPITILDFVQLKDNNQTLAASSGPEISSQLVSNVNLSELWTGLLWSVLGLKTCSSLYNMYHISDWVCSGEVVKALRYKLAGRGFDSRWFHWNFSLT